MGQYLLVSSGLGSLPGLKIHGQELSSLCWIVVFLLFGGWVPPEFNLDSFAPVLSGSKYI